MSDRLLTVKETSEYLNVHWQTVRNYISQGKLNATKVGRNIRIKESDVRTLLDNKTPERETFEIEIRFILNNREEIEENLIKLGAKVTYHAHVIDHWYGPNTLKDLEEKNEFYESAKGFGVRIRQQDNDYSGKINTTLEVKRLAIPYEHNTCIEQDLQVSSFDEADKLVRLMNFKNIITIDKDRLVYKYKNYKIIIDEFKDFLTCIEIELVTSENKDKTLRELRKVAKEIGLDIDSELTKTSVTHMAMEHFAKF